MLVFSVVLVLVLNGVIGRGAAAVLSRGLVPTVLLSFSLQKRHWTTLDCMWERLLLKHLRVRISPLMGEGKERTAEKEHRRREKLQREAPTRGSKEKIQQELEPKSYKHKLH